MKTGIDAIVQLAEDYSNELTSLKIKKATKDSSFYKSFGAFASEKSTEDIISEIRSSREFRDKEIQF